MRFLLPIALVAVLCGHPRAADPGPGKPVNGLAAKADLVEGEIRLTLKNVSDKPMRLCTWIGQRCIDVNWIGPDGKPRESKHYEWMTRARIRGVTGEDFITLKPGQSLVFGPQGKDSNLTLPDPEPGKHAVKLSFKNTQDGKQFKLEGVWTGSVSANEITLNLK